MKNDDAYNNRGYVANADEIIARWEEEAPAFREREAALGRARLNHTYGPHERERLDLFLPSARPAGLLVFVHGGYWRLFDRSYWSHLAAGPMAHDWAVAIPSYPLAPEARISEITASIRRAVLASADLVAGPIALTGHSAGGHLVARMACADTDLSQVVGERIRTIMPISPVADLRPLIETSMNADFRMTEADAVAESPALMTRALDVPVHVWVGGDERPAFLDQARWLHEAWDGSALTVADGKHHFDVIDPLEDPDSEMVARLVA